MTAGALSALPLATPRISIRQVFVFSLCLSALVFVVHFWSNVDGRRSLTRPRKQRTESEKGSESHNASILNVYKSRLSYVRSAFRISDSEIRLSLIRHATNRAPLYYRYGAIQGTVKTVCNLPTCIDPYSTPCVLIGFLGIISGIHVSNNGSLLELSRDLNEWVVVDITDVRVQSDHSYKHELGVCLQPIYLHTDYTIFVQFFEYWISVGATKFYIYRQSFSKEVERILDFYQKTASVDIQFVDWSHLPESVENQHAVNPNALLYRLEVMLAIVDCLHRARGETKFVAQLDLDEMIHVEKAFIGLLPLLRNVSANWTDWASLAFQSQRARIDSGWADVTTPNEIRFDTFEEIELENYVYPRPFYTKIIHRPERSFRAHIHQQREPDTDGRETFRNYAISPSQAVVVHFRRLDPTGFDWHGANASNIFEELAKSWDISYKKRLKEYNFGVSPWENRGPQVLQAVETCRKRRAAIRTHQCHNVYVCEHEVHDMLKGEWIYASDSWSSV